MKNIYLYGNMESIIGSFFCKLLNKLLLYETISLIINNAEMHG